MRRSIVVTAPDTFTAEFERCCTQYKKLHVAVAWCGNPNHTLPYQLFAGFEGKIVATIGIAFYHTHPDAVSWFQNIGADLRIFKDDAGLFHPKIYLFRSKQRYALFIGSSNLTYGGFYTNCECNCLIEGSIGTGTGQDLRNLETLLTSWRTPRFSFKPTAKWLEGYRRRYKATAQKQLKQKMKTPPRAEEDIATASWLRHAQWSVYYRKVLSGIRQRDQNGKEYHDVLDAAAEYVPVPWTVDYFRDIHKRRVIGGIKEYGWLGHVGASGRFRHLLANGTAQQWSTIVQAINGIAELDPPIDWSRLKYRLDGLVSLGPTMKVWSRLLCLVRPDLYCTVAAVSVRQNLAETLEIPQTRFNTTEGYIQLTRLVHGSPWFNSKRPSQPEEATIWKRRVAFLDAIFY